MTYIVKCWLPCKMLLPFLLIVFGSVRPPVDRYVCIVITRLAPSESRALMIKVVKSEDDVFYYTYTRLKLPTLYISI